MRCVSHLRAGGYRVEGGLVCVACGAHIGLPLGDTITWAQFRSEFPTGSRCQYCGKWVDVPQQRTPVVVAPPPTIRRAAPPAQSRFDLMTPLYAIACREWSPWTLVRIAIIASAVVRLLTSLNGGDR